LNVPAAGLYRISFRVSSTAPAQVKVGHSSFNFGIKAVPSTGGQWQTITDTITLPALSYTGIHVVSGTFKFNWFTIDNCGTGSGQQPNRLYVTGSNKQIGEEGIALKTTVYPNPANGNILITPAANAYKVIKVYDMMGKLIDRWNITPGKTVMSKDISTFPAGTYLLSFEGASKKETLRIVKQ
jgi:hypothetical protein